jgi:membrane-bound serine protease (ClpP class)
MAPGTAAGAAHPVVLIGPVQLKPDEEMNRKIENDAAALIRSVASKRGRNVEGAEGAVRESKSFTEQEALAQHLIDYVASSPEDLFRQMKGKPFKRFNGDSATLDLEGQPMVPFNMTLKEQFSTLSWNPTGVLATAIGALAPYRVQSSGRSDSGTVGVVSRSPHSLNLLPTALLPLSDPPSLCSPRKPSSFLTSSHGRRHRPAHPWAGFSCTPIPEMRVHLAPRWRAARQITTAFPMSIALKARRNKVVTGEQGLRRNRRRADGAFTAGKSLRSRRTLGCGLVLAATDWAVSSRSPSRRTHAAGGTTGSSVINTRASRAGVVHHRWH